jgi:transitional endoplasmic reticulum ATPase
MSIEVTVGDTVAITSDKQTTYACVWRAHPDDEGKGIIRMDSLIRDNAGVGIGDHVRVVRAFPVAATMVAISPVVEEGRELQIDSSIVSVLRRGLFRRVVTKDDVIVVKGVALTDRALPFVVEETQPCGPVIITETTKFELREYTLGDFDMEPKSATWVLNHVGILFSAEDGNQFVLKFDNGISVSIEKDAAMTLINSHNVKHSNYFRKNGEWMVAE